MSTSDIRLDTRVLRKLKDGARDRAHDILDATAFTIEGEAKKRALVDTGAMVNSIYVSGTRGERARDDYRANSALARRRNERARIVPEVKPSGEFERIIGASVEYAYWVEVKTKPFLVPSVEEQRKALKEAWAALAEL